MASSSSSSFSEPKPKYPKPYLETPYVTEMFGELYFRENPSAPPVTMSELFGDLPKRTPQPSPDSAFVCEMFGELLFKENPSSLVSISELFPDFPKPLPKPENNETNCNNEGKDEKASEKEAPKLVENDQMEVANIRKRDKDKPRHVYNGEPLIIDGRVFPPVITSLRFANNGKPSANSMMSKKNVGSSASEDTNVPPNGTA